MADHPTWRLRSMEMLAKGEPVSQRPRRRSAGGRRTVQRQLCSPFLVSRSFSLARTALEALGLLDRS